MTVRPGQHDMQLFWLTVLGAVRAAAGTGEGGAQLPPVTPGSSGSAMMDKLLSEPTPTPWHSLNSRLEDPAGLQLTLFSDLP